ncbi:MAG: Fur family transcriptional regulator [Alphaproteobacteria bacterium]
MTRHRAHEHPAFAGARHDHDRCAHQALAAAATLCAARGARLTPVRRRVLELIWRNHEPVGAYDLLAALAEGRRAAPPTVYRALDFLIAHGLVHRIASLNAFVGCPSPSRRHVGQFLICRRCGNAAEIDDAQIGRAVADSANRVGFAIDRAAVEISGQCPQCAAAR